MKNKFNFWNLLILILIILTILFLVLSVSFLGNNEEQETENYLNCQNMSVISTSYCLRDWVETFYKYNETDDSQTKSFERLKEEGGDCRDFSLLYEKIGGELGFYNYSFPIKNHRFAVLSDGKTFCVLNMLHVECFGN